MREIKFKGKRKRTGEWVYGYLSDETETFLDKKYTHKVIFENLKSFQTDNFMYVVRDCEVDPETVGQFTGLHDKNGTPIYEGDIIDFGLNAVVKYHPFLCSFILDCDNREPHLNDSYSELGFMEKTSKKFVVIGNIHDTPELLK